MRMLVADLRYALRTLGRQPVFALAAILTLMLGIGANTAIFSIVYGLLFRPLPYPDAGRLVMAWSSMPERGWTHTDVSPADVVDWEGAPSVAEFAVIGRESVNLTGEEQPLQIEAKQVTPNLFRLLGTQPKPGRDFAVSDGEPGAAPVVILSYGFWQRQYGGRPDVVGGTIQLNGEAVTVVGVLPADFRYPDADPSVFVPFREALTSWSRSNHAYNAIGRLAPGATVDGASAEVEQIAARLAGEYAETNEGWTASVVSLHADLLGDTARQASVVLMAAVLLVLLMACVNVANLLLARGNARRREMAVRSALGSGRWRLVRPMLVESLVLALGGGSLGVLLAVYGTRIIVAALPADVPPVFHFAVDTPVLVFALAASLVATLLFGLAPAARGAAVSARELGNRGSVRGRSSRRFGSALVVTQTALAVVLLLGGGIMMRSVSSMRSQETGWTADGVLTLRTTPPSSKYEDAGALQRFYDDALERIRAVPGVGAAGTIQSLPLAGANNVSSYTFEEESATEGHPARIARLSAGYLEAIGARMLRGRSFLPTDDTTGSKVAVVNETLARRVGEREVIGRTLRLNGDSWTVVGVVGDMLERALTRAPEPSIYLPAAQSATRSRSFVVRTVVDPLTTVDAIRRAVWAVDPEQPVFEVRPLASLIDVRVGPFRVIAGLMLCFAVVSLLLGGVGVYGVTAYAVGGRTNEIGVRIALGADRGEVVRMITREGMRRAVLGLAIGLLAGFGFTRAMAALLVGVSPTDPLTFGSVVLLLLAVTLLATWLPSRRAARLDPLRALAAE